MFRQLNRRGIAAVPLLSLHAPGTRAVHGASSSAMVAHQPPLPLEGVEGPGGTRVFWAQRVAHANPQDLKRSHMLERTADKKSRFAVRNRLRDDGVLSNLYPLRFISATSPIYVYEMYVTRTASPPDSSPATATTTTAAAVEPAKRKGKGRKGKAVAVAGAEERRVYPGRAWSAINRFLTQRFADSLPPVVQLEQRVYSPVPLPAEALTVPAEYRDLGWVTCELRAEGTCRYAELPAARLQELVNKIIVWAMRTDNAQRGGFDVVKQATGKLVSTTSGVSAGGLRVFRGTQATAHFVDESGQSVPPPGAATPTALEAARAAVVSRDLGTAAAGTITAPVRFAVVEAARSFTYKGKKVESYKIADASGTYLVSVWEPPEPGALVAGRVYTVTGARLRVFPERQNMRLFEFLAGGGTTWVEDSAPAATAAAAAAGEAVSSTSSCLASHPGQLAIKIDTKGTIASESSLWDDVRQHYGAGPYSDEARERIRRSVEGTPCVTSHSLLQGVVRELRFPATAAELAETLSPRVTDGKLRRYLPFVDPGQPCAVLGNGLVFPLQMLHCCFDPRMRGWQDVAIAVLSVMPARRMELLEVFRAALAVGLRRWGLELAAEPWHTRTLSVLPQPFKDPRAGAPPGPSAQQHLRHPPPMPYPTSVVVVGVASARATEEEARRVSMTTQKMAQYFKTPHVTVVREEAEAVRFTADAAVIPQEGGGPGQLRDPNTALILVTPERETRATRWVLAESLSRGIMPLVMPPSNTPANAAKLCGAARRQLLAKFECNPLRGVEVARELPGLAGRRVLVVGVDTCHTNTVSTGALVGILIAPERNHLLPVFWRHDARGREAKGASVHFRTVLAEAAALYDGIDEVVVFQDGDTFSELNSTKEELVAQLPRCGLSFLCLHKRTNIRFVHGTPHSAPGTHNNVVKGVVVPTLTPVPLDCELAAPSFYLQTHESNMSTARTVQYTVHHTSPTLPLSDVQLLANVMANVLAPAATKLPMSTRCAHKLADLSERLLDAVPQLESHMIAPSIRQRLWFL